MENLVDNFGSLRGSRILITGHTGFKGSWLTKLLETFGITIYGLALKPTSNSLNSKLEWKSIIDEKFLDINEFNEVKNYIEFVKPNLVFHLAAQPLVIESYKYPLYTFQTNVMGTVNVLEAIRQSELDCSVVAVTTDKVYKNQESPLGYTEDSPLGGLDPYSASKSAMEMAIIAWQNMNHSIDGPKIVSVRSGNVIGGGDFSQNRLVPDIVTALQAGEKIKIRNPESIRPWQHVLDPLMGYIAIAERILQKSEVSGTYNFGPDESSRLTVADIANIALSQWPSKSKGWEYSGSGSTKHVETDLLWLNSDRARKDLAWKNYLSGVESVHWTLNWALQEPLIGANAITENQIQNYLEKWFP